MKAAIFDFDGTIVDTETLWVEVYAQFIEEEYQHTVPMEVFHNCIGTKDTVLYDYLHKYVDSSISRSSITPIVEKRVAEKLVTLKPRFGVVELIQRCQNAGLRLAIASGSDGKWIHQFLQKNDLAHYFEAIRCADDVVNVKPHPELYLAALDALQLASHECFAIEDSVNGSASAIAAQIKCFVIPNELTIQSPFNKEAIILNNFEQLTVDLMKEKVE